MQALAEAGVIYLSKRRPALSGLWFRSKAVWRHDPERHRDLAIHRIPAAVGRRASSVGRARISSPRSPNARAGRTDQIRLGSHRSGDRLQIGAWRGRHRE
jgi:hypothetical protein